MSDPIAEPTAGRARAGPGRPPRSGAPDAALRERILDAAEAQFSRLGYDGVSTRGVAREVGATPAMIHYYFNTKRELFDAVFSRRAEVINADRMAAFDAYERDVGDEITVEGAIAAFIRPVLARFQESQGWRDYLALVAQIGNKHEWGGAVMTRYFDPVIERLVGLVRRALPGASDVDLYWSYHLLSGALLLTLSETDRINRLSGGQCRSDDIAAIEPRLVAFAAAGFRRVCCGG